MLQSCKQQFLSDQTVFSDEASVSRLVRSFTERYPVTAIPALSVEQYAAGFPDSFCQNLHRQMEDLCHIGNIFNSAFGIYLNGSKKITLSRSYDKLFGRNIEQAFAAIKQAIVDLLLDPYSVETCPLNSSFRYKLLSVYYPHLMIPVCTKDTIRAYCRAIGLVYDNDESVWTLNLRLMHLRKTFFPEFGTYLYMRFLDKLWRNRIVLNDADIQSEDEIFVMDREHETLTRIRNNQSVFRLRLLQCSQKCAVCGLSFTDLLTPSHIKPWSKATAQEKLDPDNGLLLCPNHNRLFDRHLISFENDGSLLVSPLLKPSTIKKLGLGSPVKITVNDRMRHFMAFHRREFFRKNTL